MAFANLAEIFIFGIFTFLNQGAKGLRMSIVAQDFGTVQPMFHLAAFNHNPGMIPFIYGFDGFIFCWNQVIER